MSRVHAGIRKLVLAAMLILLSLPVGLSGQEEGLPVGSRPTAVVLHDLDGQAVDLGALAGTRPVVVEFWATWCAVCRALEPRMSAAHERFGDRAEFLVVAIGVAQTEASVSRHLQRHPVRGRVLWDGKGEAVRAFEAPGTGYVVVLDADGTVAYTGTGADQDLEAVLERLIER